MQRELFKYVAVLHGTDGQTVEVPFETYWNPQYEDVLAEVANAAAATHTIAGKRDSKGNPLVRYVGVSSSLVAP